MKKYFLSFKDEKKVINKIRDFRLHAGLTQLELGHLVGLSDEAISMYERQQFQPSLHQIIKLLKVFNCSFEDLFVEEDV